MKMLEERENAGKLEGSFDINEVNRMMDTQKKNKPKENYGLKGGGRADAWRPEALPR